MKVVCAWCGQVLSDPWAPGPVSHGICKPCEIRIRFRREPISDFLDKLPAPVMAVDGDGRVLGANQAALAMVDAGRDEVAGRLGGDVMSCVHAAEPGGCGRTVHCSGCAVRRSFEHTMATGENLRDVESYVYVRDESGLRRLSLVVATERVGDLVLVRMEAAHEG